MDKFSMALDSSDDEAPEEVTFEDSKASALRCMKQALDTAKREKELLKEKRRRKHELFQEQKKRRLLPTDVLEEIDTAPSKKQKSSEHQDDEEQEDEEAGGSEDEGEGSEKEDEGRKKKADVRNLKGNYTVMTTKARAASSSQQQDAMDFLQSRLYGPGSCRTTSNELLSLDNKRTKNKSAAVQFIKKDWASKEKVKAEKIKKRWLHKQQIPS